MEHSGAAINNVSDLLVVVMGLENALMAVTRLDVVSYNYYINILAVPVVLKTPLEFRLCRLHRIIG